MANPFRRFRKNQKAWIAGLTVFVMFIFIVGSAGISVFTSSCSSYQPGLAVETKVRSFTEQELRQRQALRAKLNQFLDVITFGRPERARSGIVLFGPDDQRSVFNTWLKAQKAQDMGITVNDEAINQFIGREAQPPRSREELVQILTNLGLSERELFDGLRTELLARRLDELFGLNTVSIRSNRNGERQAFVVPRSARIPSERKEIWDKIHRRVYAEAVAVPVSAFVSEVPDPSEEDLKRFFEMFREDYPPEDRPFASNPGRSPDPYHPGFKLPPLAQFQYFRTNADRFDEAATAVVTDAQVRQRYEEEKEKARDNENHRLRFKQEDFLKWLKDEREKRAEKEKEKEKEKSPSDAKKAKTTDGKTDGSGAARTPRGPRLYPVSFQPKSDEKRTDASKKKPAEKKTAGKEDEKKSTEKKPAKADDAKKKEEDEPLDLLRPLDAILDTDLTIPEDITGGKQPEFKPLWREEGRIRNELAGEHARQDMSQLLGFIREALEPYYETWTHWDAQQKGPEPPNPLNDPQKRAAILQDAWDRLVKAKREEWKKSFEQRKTDVDAEIDKLLAEQKLKTRAELKAKAEKANRKDWSDLVADAEKLADVDKLVAETAEKWSGHFAALKEPFEAPAPGKEFQPTLTFDTTGPGPQKRGLSQREFNEKEYSITAAMVGGAPFMQGKFESAVMYKPELATHFHRADQFLFWKIAQRRKAVPVWKKEVDDPDPEAREVDRALVRAEWKKVRARNKTLEYARDQIAARIRATTQRFPIDEIQRHFKIDAGTLAPVELTDRDRPDLKFARPTRPRYGIAVEVFEKGKRGALGLGPQKEPLEAPPHGDSRVAAEARAKRIVEDKKQANLLVILGQSTATLYDELVYRGITAYRWDPQKQQAIAWPGLIAGQEFVIGQGEKKVTETGQQLEPFTWYGALSGTPIAGLAAPGGELVDVLFDLPRGGVGAALDQAQSAAYVVQVTDFDYEINGQVYPDDASLPGNAMAEQFFTSASGQVNLERFMQQGFVLPDQMMRSPEFQLQMRHDLRSYEEWISALEDEYKVKWK